MCIRDRSNLDAKLRGQMRTEISRLQRRLGITTVYVTHDQTEAMTLGDRVAVLRKGVLQQVASPRELYQRPVNLFVAGFIGSPPMNFVPAEIEGRKVSLPFVSFEVAQEVADRFGDSQLLIAGIRPEHFEDAALVDATSQSIPFSAHVDVTEWLGNELFAYIPFETSSEIHERLKTLARELDSESLRTQLVVALDAGSRIEPGEEAKLVFDASKMHFFDPVSGENLTRELAAVAS